MRLSIMLEKSVDERLLQLAAPFTHFFMLTKRRDPLDERRLAECSNRQIASSAWHRPRPKSAAGIATRL